MCGIAGVVSATAMEPEQAIALASTMADTLIHRGPDGTGTEIDPSARTVLAQRRLAIIDLSPAGRQPMISRSGRWTLVFNGEIYNHRAIRSELESAGISFRGHSDTETLVEAIDRWGLEPALERTNGMFAIAAWDRDRRMLVLARDRLGEKPLYWLHEGTDRFAFASELRALRVLPGVDMQIDPAAATALLHWSFVPHPNTIYAGVRQLPPGGLLEVSISDSDVKVTERSWWSLGDTLDAAINDRSTLTLDEAAEQLETLLADAVAMRLESDVPLGSFLSGGIDSSLISALAQRAQPDRTLRTFTVSMPELGFDESQHAATVARYLGTDHQTVDLSLADAFDLIPKLPAIWDEPFADPSMLPTALLCRTARQQLTVCLGGDGGDELFAGYNRHVFGASISRRAAHVPAGVRRAIAAGLLAPSPRTIDRASHAVSRVLPAGRRIPNAGDKVQKVAALLRADGRSWDTLAQIWPSSDLGPTPAGPSVPHLSGRLDEVEQLMLADTSAVLPDQMLVKLDRGSMAASLEVRAPFLDHRLLEWAWRQPTSIKTSGGVGKVVLRRVAERVLPTEIVERPKMGFDPPLGAWLRNELRPWASDLLAAPRSVSEGWIDGAAVQRTWAEHSSGERNWDYRLWGVLMLEAWLAEHHPMP
jgi:asparagine synthase (glutamine-hydrolysing)